MASGFIFPVSVYGQVSDVFGTNITAYANTLGFPGGSGLQLGMFGVLFDRTICRLIKAGGGINPNDAMYNQIGNSNDYTLLQTTALGQKVLAINDRAGSTPLVSGNIAWATEQGIATANVLGSLTAGAQTLVSSATAGFLGPYTMGTVSGANVIGQSVQTNIDLLNTTTTQGTYPVRIG